jgi:CRISP-associated protein Cas1
MKLLILNGHGLSMHVDSARLIIKDGRSDDAEPQEYIFKPKRIDVEHIVVYGQSGSISVDAIRWLIKHNVQVSILDWNGKLLTTMLPPEGVTVDIKFAQYQAHQDNTKHLSLAKNFINAKFVKQQAFLDWLQSRYPTVETNFSKISKQLGFAKSVKEIILIESQVAQFYWEQFAKAVPKKHEFEFRKNFTTNMMGSSDEVNTMLNYGYALLEAECLRAINSIGLDRHVGFVHELRSGSNALAYDFQELFRYIVDMTVIALLEANIMQKSDFIRTENYSLRLRPSGVKKLVTEFNKQLNRKTDYINKDLTVSYVLFLKVRELAQHLVGKKSSLDLSTPVPLLVRMDTDWLRAKIKKITYAQWKKLGLSKGTLHYMKQNANSDEPFTLNKHILDIVRNLS